MMGVCERVLVYYVCSVGVAVVKYKLTNSESAYLRLKGRGPSRREAVTTRCRWWLGRS